MKFKEFVSKYRKAIIIVASAAFIGAGVTTGLIITSYGNHTVAPASSGVASSTSSHISVPPIEPDASSSESTVATSSAAPAAEEVKNSSVAASSKANSTATSSKKPTTSSKTSKPVQNPTVSSKPSGGSNTSSRSNTSSKPTTTGGGGWQDQLFTDTTITCKTCGTKYDVKKHDKCPGCGYDLTKCKHCGRKIGDGHNGTCNAEYDPLTDKWVACHNYD